jgi:CBS domain-containing protein
MQVRKHMSAPAITVRADADYRTAFDVMRERDFHHLPVVDAGGRLVGIVAQRDMMVAATRHHNAPVEIAEVMHRPVVSTHADVQVVEAARLMMSQNIGCLPVVDAEMNVLGVISERDLLEVFVRMLSSGASRGAPAKRKATSAKHKPAPAKHKATPAQHKAAPAKRKTANRATARNASSRVKANRTPRKR